MSLKVQRLNPGLRLRVFLACVPPEVSLAATASLQNLRRSWRTSDDFQMEVLRPVTVRFVRQRFRWTERAGPSCGGPGPERGGSTIVPEVIRTSTWTN